MRAGTPTDEELEKMSFEIAVIWERLGRRRGFKEPEMREIDEAHDRLSEKGCHMLKHWKRTQGSAATYQDLYDASGNKSP